MEETDFAERYTIAIQIFSAILTEKKNKFSREAKQK